MLEIRARKISSSVQMTTCPGYRGQVHSVFERVVNLVTDGVLITLADQQIGEPPNGVIVELAGDQDFKTYPIRSGSVCYGDGKQLIFNQAGLSINLTEAAIFHAKKELTPPLGSLETQFDRLTAIQEIAVEYAPREGLAPLWYKPLSSAPVYNVTPSFSSVLLSNAQGAIFQLRKGIQQANIGLAQQGITTLAGLGVGLTPSGDDILTGLAAALGLYEKAIQITGRYENIFQIMLESVARNSNPISLNYLAQAIRLEISSELFEFIRCLFEQKAEKIKKAIQNLFSYGATSGAELGLGAFLGASISLEKKLESIQTA